MRVLDKAESDRMIKVVTNIAAELEIPLCKLSEIVYVSAVELDKQTVQNELSNESLKQISYLIRIYKALHKLFSDAAQANGWLQSTNGHFNNRTALEVISGDPAIQLKTVAAYLEHQLV